MKHTPKWQAARPCSANDLISVHGGTQCSNCGFLYPLPASRFNTMPRAEAEQILKETSWNPRA